MAPRNQTSNSSAAALRGGGALRARTAPARRTTEFTLDRAYQDEPELDASEEDKANYVVARFGVQNDHYNGLFQTWIKPIFFLVSKQWIRWNEQQQNYTLDTDVPKWRQQPVTNWTYAVFRALMAKMVKQRPAFEVIPPSGDSDDRDSAKLGQSVLDYLFRECRVPKKRKRGLAWFLCTGNVAFDVGWDPDAGESRPRSVLVEIPDETAPAGSGETVNAEVAADENGEPQRREPADDNEPAALDGGKPYDFDAEPEREPIGEISLTVDEPFAYRFNPEATDEDDADEMFVAYLWPIARVCREFDVEREDITIVSTNEGEDRLQELKDLLSSVTAGGPDPFNNKAERLGSSQQNAMGERVLVIKYYRDKCPAEGYPDGRHWITAGGSKVWPKEGDAEYPNAEAPLPFGFWPPRVVVTDTPVPGQPQGLGVLGQVVPLNEKYNFQDGKIGEYHTTMAMGGVIWVHPADKGITITSEPGQVKVSKGLAEGHPPVREELHPLPAPVYQERELIVNNIMAIAGTSQLDLGQKPEGVSAGRAFLVIQEASDNAIMPSIMAWEDAEEEIGRRMLVIAQQMYTEERTVRIRGERGKWEFHSFTGADLVDGLDVRVQTGSSFPWSKSAQWDTKLNLLSTPAGMGLVMDPQTGKVDREQLARFLDSGAPGLGAFESDQDPDLVEIDREHAMFEVFDPSRSDRSNQVPQVGFWQDHAKHLEGHYNFMKRDYGRFEHWSPAAQMAFIEHCQLTQQAIERAIAEALPSTPGGPPAGGPAAPPGNPAPAGAPAPAGPPSPAGGAPGGGQMQLTRGDRAAAGQAA